MEPTVHAIKKKTPIGVSMMTQPTIRMSVSNIDVKKSRAGLALSPPIARAIPNSKLTTMTLSGLPLLISPKALVGIN